MVSENEAYAICYAQINQPDLSWPEKPEIVIISTVEREHSWVFYYQSKPYVEHGDFGQSLVGNGPCVVVKSDGCFAFTATFPPIDERVSEAEAWLLSGGTIGARSVVAHK
jgi:hypothetical protein